MFLDSIFYADSKYDIDFTGKTIFEAQTVELGHSFFLVIGSILILWPYLNKESELKEKNG